jgi:hypothetical protein
MAVHTEIHFAPVDELYLDPKNPRLGRREVEKHLSQAEILALMQRFTLDEIGVSVVNAGFWPQEALVVVREPLGKAGKALHNVVVEGNRRLAAVKMLKLAVEGGEVEPWRSLVGDLKKPQLKKLTETLVHIPYILVDSRDDVRAYIGFRHVTGIKQWDPAEKAEYINSLIASGMNYKQVTDCIGSKVGFVRQAYISYRILLQMEEQEEIHIPSVEEKFSVLTLSLRTEGVRTFLGVDIQADEKTAKRPIPKDKLDHLVKFALWLFGTEEVEAIVTDSRKIEKFGRILLDEKAVEYLDQAANPKFEMADRIAGGDAIEVAEAIEQSAFQLEEALGTVHLVRADKRVRDGVKRLVQDVAQLLTTFPQFKTLICDEGKK